MRIKINPIDLLFFGNSRPFEKGIDSWAESLLVPNYSTIYGALRTLYVTEFPELYDTLNTEKDITLGLVIEKVSYWYNGNEYYPAPCDLVLDKNIEDGKSKDKRKKNDYMGFKLNPQKVNFRNNSMCHQAGLEYIFTAPDTIKAESLSGAYIDVKRRLYRRYALPDCKEVSLISINKCIEMENHVGIGLSDETNSSAEGLIYRKTRMKYQNLSILVDFRNDKMAHEFILPEKGILKLGGYGNIASYTLENKKTDIKSNTVNIITDIVKVYLQAPAIFQKGWIPDFLSSEEKTGELNINGESYQATLLGACVPGYQNISGFDMKLKREKTFYKAVPAGSVYLLKLDRKITLKQTLNEIHLESKLSREGFGLAYIIGERAEEMNQ